MYETARNGDAFWLYTNTPEMSSNWSWAFHDLVTALSNTWTLRGNNIYDQPQWALVFLLQGSLMVFMALLMTINLTPFWRTLTIMLFSIWSLDLSAQLIDRMFPISCIGQLY
jgi:hypothetical protein